MYDLKFDIMKFRYLLCLGFAFFQFITFSFSQEWTVPISINNNNGIGDTVFFGIHPEGTYGLDPQLGEVNLPPLPPISVFDVRFLITGYEGFKIDIRDTTSTERIHKLKWQVGTGGYPVTVKWDPTAFGPGTYEISDPFGGVFIPVHDMQEDSMIIIPSNLNFVNQLNLRIIPEPSLPQPPVIIGITDYQVFSGQRFPCVQLNNCVNDPDTPLELLNWSAGAEYPLVVSITQENILTVTYPVGWIGAKIVYINVTDPQGNSDNISVQFESLEPGVVRWSIPITVTNGSQENETLNFGIDPLGTDGLDLILGEQNLPPLPPDGIFDSRFIFPNNTFSSLIDIRQSSPAQITYNLKFLAGSGGFPVTFTWNNSILPEGEFYISDELNGTFIPPIDMKIHTQVSIPESLSLIEGMVIKATPEMDLISPIGPDSLWVISGGEGFVSLQWELGSDLNFDYYEILFDTAFFQLSSLWVWDWSNDLNLKYSNSNSTTIDLPTSNAIYYFRIRAWDTFGNSSELSDVCWYSTLENVPPIPIGFPLDTIYINIGDNYQDTIKFWSPEPDQITSISINPGALSSFNYLTIPGTYASAVFNLTGTITNMGTWSVEFIGIDNGNPPQLSNGVVDFKIIDSPPEIISDPILEILEQANYEYDVNASDPDQEFGDTLIYQLISAPTGMSINNQNGVISWIPYDINVGYHAITISAIDLFGLSDTQSFILHVINVNSPPTISPVLSDSLYEDFSSHFIPLAGIFDGDYYAVQNLSIYAISSNPFILPDPIINYVPNNSIGTLQLTSISNSVGLATIDIIIKDNGGTANGGIDSTVIAFNITILSVNDPPQMLPLVDPLPIPEDSPIQTLFLSGIHDGDTEAIQNISISGTSADTNIINHPVIYYLPNSDTGRITYIPKHNKYGVIKITLTISDDGGILNGGINFKFIDFNVAVLPVNDPPISNAGPNQIVYGGDLVTLNGYGSFDIDNDPLSFQWNSPPGIVLSNPNIPNPTFQSPYSCADTSFTFTLTVNDGLLSSDADSIIIYTTASKPNLSCHPSTITDTIITGKTFNYFLRLKNIGYCQLNYNVATESLWLEGLPMTGNLDNGDSITINLTVNTDNLITGIYSTNIQITSNDPVNPIAQIPFIVKVNHPLTASASCDPSIICIGDSTKLISQPVGGSMKYLYHWESDPDGFTSDQASPYAHPVENTTYYLRVIDEFDTVYASTSVNLLQYEYYGSVSKQTINFDTVFYQEGKFDTVFLYNEGCRVLQITNIYTSLSHFQVYPASCQIQPGSYQAIIVQFLPLSIGTIEDNLYFQSNASNNEELTVSLHGYCRFPIIDVSFSQAVTTNPVIPNDHDSISFRLPILLTGERGYEGLQYKISNPSLNLQYIKMIEEYMEVDQIYYAYFKVPVILEPGVYSWNIVLDPYQQLTEFNTGNNSHLISFEVITAPEFSISGLTLSKNTFLLGEALNGDLTISNWGEDSVSQVGYTILGKTILNQQYEIGSGQIPLPGLSSVPISFTFTPNLLPGTHKIYAFVDNSDFYKEDDETNNLDSNYIVGILPNPSLSISCPSSIEVLDTISVKITINNNCLFNFNNLELTLYLPPVFKYIQSNPVPIISDSLVWSWAQLPLQNILEINLKIQLKENTGAEGSIISLIPKLYFELPGYSAGYSTNALTTVQLGNDLRPPVLICAITPEYSNGSAVNVTLESDEYLKEYPVYYLINPSGDTLLNGNYIGNNKDFMVQIAPNLSWPEGTYKLLTIASDSSGNDGSIDQQFKIDKTASSISINLPDIVSHESFIFTVQSSEMLKSQPQISIQIEGISFQPNFLSQTGNLFNFSFIIPGIYQPLEITFEIQIEDLASNFSVLSKTIPCDFIPPQINHTFPDMVSNGVFEVDINSNEPLKSTPLLWITDNGGKPVEKQGPFKISDSQYKLFFLINSQTASGVISVFGTFRDKANNVNQFNHHISCDLIGPVLNLTIHPQYPTGNFTAKIYSSEPIVLPMDIELLGNQPGELISPPNPIWVTDHYEFHFFNESISKISVTAFDTIGLPGSVSKTYTDVEISYEPFLFSTIPNGTEDCIVKIPCKNLSGVPVENLKVILYSGSSSNKIVVDSTYINLSGFGNAYAEVIWPSSLQTIDYRLSASINGNNDLPETNFNNNFRMFRRLNIYSELDQPVYVLNQDNEASLISKYYSNMKGDYLTDEELAPFIKIYNSDFTTEIDSISYVNYSQPNFIFYIPLNILPDTGNYKCILFVNDSTGLNNLTDTINLRFINEVNIELATNKEVYNRYENVEIFGNIHFGYNEPIDSLPMTIKIISSGGIRQYIILSDQNGDFEYNFQPFQQEAGSYTIELIANIDGRNFTYQKNFEILGLLLAPYEYTIKLSRNSSLNSTIRCRNIGITNINNINLSINDQNLNDGVSVVLGSYNTSLAAGQYADIPITVLSAPGIPLTAEFIIVVNADQGEMESGIIWVNTGEAVPHLYSSVNNTEVILNPGQVKTQYISFWNAGFENAMNPQIIVPNIPFANIISPPNMDMIAIGDTAIFQLNITPDTTIPEGLYADFLTLTCSNHDPVKTGVSIFVTHNNYGKLKVTTLNNITDTVPNATVFLYSQNYDPYTHSYPVFSGQTNSDGFITFDSIRSGNYFYQVTADQHSPKIGGIDISPVITNKLKDGEYQELVTVLDLDLITYQWSVEETTTGDEYNINLEVIIEPINENIVPPVLIASPNVLAHEFAIDQDQNIKFGTFSITNYGTLIAYNIVPENTEFVIYDESALYKVKIWYYDDLLNIGLAHNSSGSVLYTVEKLIENTTEAHHIQTWIPIYNQYRLHFLGQYSYNNTTLSTECFVDLDLKIVEGQCLTISPPIIHRTALNGEILDFATTQNLSLYNPSTSSGTELNGGYGMYILDYGIGPESAIIDFIDGFTFGMVGFMTNYIDFVQSALDPNFFIFDALVGGPVFINPSQTVQVPINWRTPEPGYDFVEFSLGIMVAPYQCSGGNVKFKLIPMTSISMSTLGIGGGDGFSYTGSFPTSGSSGGYGGGGFGSAGTISSLLNPPPGPNNNQIDVIHMSIDQSLTLERQAFNAQLLLHNDTDFPIYEFGMNVITKDEFGQIITEDENSESCPLFFQIPVLTGINAIDGSGYIPPQSDVLIHWLIIPKVGSGGENGIDYLLQGHFTFSINDTTLEYFTADENITIKPTPLLDIEYAIPEIFIENEPFYMSTAISNNGYDTAHNVQLESGQPQLECYDDQGNSVPCGNYNIEILGGFMDDKYQTNSMIINYGDISSSTTKVGYWEFLSTFSGTVTDFTATINHSNDLGGESTSLVNGVSTNILYQMIGYGNYSNYLSYQLSNKNTDSLVHLIAIDSTFNSSPDYLLNASNGDHYNLSVLQSNIIHPATIQEPYVTLNLINNEGWINTSIGKPFGNNKVIDKIINNTGLVLNNKQYWIENNQINLIDYALTNGSYTITFRDLIEPDLAIYNNLLTWNPLYPQDGDILNFNIKVNNNGEMASGTTDLNLYHSKQNINYLYKNIPIESISPFSNLNKSFDLDSDSLDWGWNYLRIKLDEDSLLPDINRNNNIIDFEIFKNRSPYIVGDTNLTANIGVLFNYQIQAFDPDVVFNDSLHFILINNPSWLIINQKTGEINGTPPEVGLFDFSVKVQDNYNGFYLQEYSIEVIGIEINLDLKAYLQGPFFNGKMVPFLNLFGYLPTVQPYDRMPWNYFGSESIPLFTSYNIIDWVLVDIVKFTNGLTNYSVGRRAGFINFDGRITDLDGISPLLVHVSDTINIHVCIHHRNHLKVYSSNPMQYNSGVYHYDFSTNANQAIGGSNVVKELAPGIWGMLSGNGNGDWQINNVDKDAVWVLERGNSGYYSGDFNMDSQVGADDKLVKWAPNVGKGCQVPD